VLACTLTLSLFKTFHLSLSLSHTHTHSLSFFLARLLLLFLLLLMFGTTHLATSTKKKRQKTRKENYIRLNKRTQEQQTSNKILINTKCTHMKKRIPFTFHHLPRTVRLVHPSSSSRSAPFHFVWVLWIVSVLCCLGCIFFLSPPEHDSTRPHAQNEMNQPTIAIHSNNQKKESRTTIVRCWCCTATRHQEDWESASFPCYPSIHPLIFSATLLSSSTTQRQEDKKKKRSGPRFLDTFAVISSHLLLPMPINFVSKP
jgi:cytochrome c biogenesis factor